MMLVKVAFLFQFLLLISGFDLELEGLSDVYGL